MAVQINTYTGQIQNVGVWTKKYAGAPTSADYQYPLGFQWIDTSAGALYFLASVSGTTASWEKVIGGSTGLTQLDSDSGSATPSAGVIDLAGTSAQGITTSATGNTITFTIANTTETQKGVVELATTTEATTGTDTARAITAAGMAAKLGTQTDHGVLVGSGSTAAVTALSVGTNGQVLVGSSSADPIFATIGSSDSTIAWTLGAGTLTAQARAGTESVTGVVEFATAAETTTGTSTALAVHPSGLNTKLGTQTQYVPLIGGGGAGSNLGELAAAGTNGQLMVGSTGAAPVFATPGSSDSTIAWTLGAGTLTAQARAGTESVTGVVELATAAETTTGTSTALAVHPSGLNTKLGTQTVHGVMIGGGGAGANLAATAAGTAGQVLQSTGASSDPGWATLGSTDSSVNITNIAGSIDFSAGGGFPLLASGDGLAGSSLYNIANVTTYPSSDARSMTADRRTFFGTIIGATISPTQLGVYITTAQASSHLRWGLYEDSDGIPADLVWTSDSLDTSSTGLKWSACAISISAGFYWLCAHVDTNGVAYRNAKGLLPAHSYIDASGTPAVGFYEAVGYTTLPDPYSLSFSAAEYSWPPIIAYQLT